jgi:type II secretory pathway predicted ATPase ExeA
MSVQLLQAHWGFTKMPFGRDLAPSMLHRHRCHAEAVARITWCVEQHHIGVITGEVGAGKTVAIRAATSALDASRHVSIYIANPAIGVRGLLHHSVAALGAVPSFYPATLVAQAGDALAGEQAERGRTPVLVIDFTDRGSCCP